MCIRDRENQIHVKDSIDISNMDLLIDFAKIGVGAVSYTHLDVYKRQVHNTS